MKWSITVAKIAGTQVKIHLTFLILLAWIGLEFFLRGGIGAALSGLLLFVALFGCVLLHEFGHAFAARYYGIRTPVITLLPFGGLASIERIPKKPREEIVIALAGPMVNVVIAAVLWVVSGRGEAWELAPDLEGGVPMGQLLLQINVMLVVFNLLPVFPMDGGRVFRAVLAMFFPWSKATEAAAMVGQAVAIFGGILALSAGQPFLLLIAVFIFFAAGAEASAARADGLLAGLTALDVAESEFHRVRLDEPLSVAIGHLLHSAQHHYPVVDAGGGCVGVLTQSALLAQLSQAGPESPVETAMTREFPNLDAGLPALEALRQVQAAKLPAAPLLTADGGVSHWFTVDNLTDVLLAQSALRQYAPQAFEQREREAAG